MKTVKNALATVFRAVFVCAIVAMLIFAAAGRWDLPFVWGILSVLCIFYILMVTLTDPDMVRERESPGPGNQDRLTRPLGAVLMLIHWILAGLDTGRYHWSPIPWELQLAGLIGYAAALTVNLWALRVNRFYSSVVRVQTDRGHSVVDTGPYRFVRHPGYTATLFAMLSGGVALGSGVAIVPVIGFAALFIRRTLLEDRLLRAELPGYAAYAERVRYRLIPGIF